MKLDVVTLLWIVMLQHTHFLKCEVEFFKFEFFFVNVSITAGNRSEHFIIKAADFSLSLQKNVIYKLKSRIC